MSTDALLEVTHLRVSFGGQEVVHGIDFSIRAGEKLALVGESGSGKTVSALSLLRLVHNAEVSGSALLNGRDLLGMTERELRGVRGEMLVVAGDFNDWGEKLDGPMAELGLARACAPGARASDSFTFPSRVPVFGLDRFYVRGLACRATLVPRGSSWARMSDHLPLVAELVVVP